MNGGVKLPALDEQVVGHLKELEQRDVRFWSAAPASISSASPIS